MYEAAEDVIAYSVWQMALIVKMLRCIIW